MAGEALRCCVCGVVLPNKWAVAKREKTERGEVCFCHLHANDDYAKKTEKVKTQREKGVEMAEKITPETAAREQEIAKNASGDIVKKAWAECSSLASKLGGGIKALWSKMVPDRSPEATLAALNADLANNQNRLGEMKPRLDQVYREIVAKKKEYQSASPVRQRLLKIELQTLMARYKGLEREFAVLNENERSIETVKGRFLEVLAYGKRGKLDVSMVDRLSDDLEDKVDDAEDIQDAIGDLEKAGRRSDRDGGDFDSELDAFDGELGLSDGFNADSNDKEVENEKTENDRADDKFVGVFAE